MLQGALDLTLSGSERETRDYVFDDESKAKENAIFGYRDKIQFSNSIISVSGNGEGDHVSAHFNNSCTITLIQSLENFVFYRNYRH